MATPSLSVVQDDFRRADLSTYKCIAAYGAGQYKQRCGEDITDPGQLNAAKGLLPRDLNELDRNEAGNIVLCLTCDGCQKNHKDRMRAVRSLWMSESPDIKLAGRRSSPSPNSLSGRRKRSSVSVLTLSPPGTPTPPSRPALSSTRHTESYLNVPGHDAEPPPSRERSSSAPALQSHGRGAEQVSGAASEGDVFMDGTSSSGGRQPHQTPTAIHSDTIAAPDTNQNVANVEGAAGEETPPADTDASTHSAADFRPRLPRLTAPWTLRQRVQKLILMSIPPVPGNIYVARHATEPYVKIGLTTQSADQRVKQWSKLQQQNVKSDEIWYLDVEMPSVQLLRLEALVHEDLAYWHCELPYESGSKPRKAHEWFKVPFEVAQQTVSLWWGVMKHMGMKPGTVIRTELREALTSHKYFHAHPTDTQLWEGIHRDHASRLQTWNDMLLTSQFKESMADAVSQTLPDHHGLFKAGQLTWEGILWRLMGYVFIWMLPYVFRMRKETAFLMWAASLTVWGWVVIVFA